MLGLLSCSRGSRVPRLAVTQSPHCGQPAAAPAPWPVSGAASTPPAWSRGPHDEASGTSPPKLSLQSVLPQHIPQCPRPWAHQRTRESKPEPPPWWSLCRRRKKRQRSRLYQQVGRWGSADRILLSQEKERHSKQITLKVSCAPPKPSS